MVLYFRWFSEWYTPWNYTIVFIFPIIYDTVDIFDKKSVPVVLVFSIGRYGNQRINTKSVYQSAYFRCLKIWRLQNLVVLYTGHWRNIRITRTSSPSAYVKILFLFIFSWMVLRTICLSIHALLQMKNSRIYKHKLY